MGVGAFLIAFTFGFVTAVLGAVFTFLSLLERVARNAEAGHARAVEQTRITGPSSAPPSLPTKPDECSGAAWIQIRPPTSFESVDQQQPSADDQPATKQQLSQQSQLLLRANTLFIFASEKASQCVAALCLDGCSVQVCRVRPSKFHRRNYVRVSHTSRDLMSGSRDVFVWCERGYDLERWFESLSRGSRIAQESELRDVQRQSDVFSRLAPICSAMAASKGSPGEPLACLNFLVHRIWWQSFRADMLLGLARSKIDRKLSRIKKPSMVTDLRVGSITLGPNVPLATSAQLVSATASGAITCDADIDYAGGFGIEIQCTVSISLPLRRNISVPLVIEVSVGSMSGRVRIVSLAPPASRLWIGFHGEPKIDLKFDTHVAQHASLSISAIPRVAETIVHKLRTEIVELMVLPNMDDWPIPKVPKQKQNRTSPPAPAASASPATNSSAPATTTAASSSSVPPPKPAKRAVSPAPSSTTATAAASSSAPISVKPVATPSPAPAPVPAVAPTIPAKATLPATGSETSSPVLATDPPKGGGAARTTAPGPGSASAPCSPVTRSEKEKKAPPPPLDLDKLPPAPEDPLAPQAAIPPPAPTQAPATEAPPKDPKEDIAPAVPQRPAKPLAGAPRVEVMTDDAPPLPPKVSPGHHRPPLKPAPPPPPPVVPHRQAPPVPAPTNQPPPPPSSVSGLAQPPPPAQPQPGQQ